MFKFLFLFVFIVFIAVFEAQAQDKDTVWTRKFFPDIVNKVQFTQDDRYILADVSGFSLMLLDPLTGATVKSFKELGSPFYLYGNTIVANCLSDTVKIWDLNADTLIRKVNIKVPLDSFYVFGPFYPSISPDLKHLILVKEHYGDVITKKAYSALFIFTLSDGKLIKTVKDLEGKYNNIKYSPLGNNFVTTSNTDKGVDIVIWENESFNQIGLLGHNDYLINDICFSYDGNTMASVGGIEAKIWDANNKKLIKSFNGTEAIALSNDLTKVAVGNSDHYTLQIYDYITEKLINIFPYNIISVSNLEFSNDISLLLAGGGSRIVLCNLNKTIVNETPKIIQDIDLFPNPIKNLLEIRITAINPTLLNYSISDITGRIIKNLENININIGENQLNIDLKDFPVGSYQITFITPNYQITKSFIKN